MGNFHPSREAAPLVRIAQRHGFKVMCHTGGVSIPDSSPVTADDLLEIAPDVAGHVNGGTTSLPDADLPRVIATDMALQICQAGNLRSALEVLRLAREADELERVLAASDTPTGTGIIPLAVIKSVVELSSLGQVPAPQALCFATGNVARAYDLEAGFAEVGAPADLILIDAPGASSAATAFEAIEIGDLPGIGAVITSGILRALPSRNTPPPTHIPELASGA
jgi:enamidase